MTRTQHTESAIRISRTAVSAGKGAPASTIPELVEAYLEHCRDRKLSPKTVEWAYGWPLRKLFVPYCERIGVRSIEDLDDQAAGRFARELHEKKLATASVRSYLTGVNTFLNWARRPTAPRPLLRKKERDVLTLREMRKLEAVCPSTRDQLMIRIMADTGMRESELVSLRIDDVLDRDGNAFLRIRGKTGERMPSISPEVRERLRRYIAHERPRDAMTKQVFVAHSRSSRSRIHEGLTKSGVYQLVKNAAARLGWEKRVHPHLLKHSNVTHRLKRQQNPADIVAETGVSIEILVKNYSHPAPVDRHRSTMAMLEEEEDE